MHTHIEVCPKCHEEEYLRHVWAKGRKLQWQCRNCDWRGELEEPERIPITGKERVSMRGWRFELFDQYGHTAVYSQGYDSREKTIEELKKSLISHNSIDGYGECTGVIWPPSIEVQGEVIRLKDLSNVQTGVADA